MDEDVKLKDFLTENNVSYIYDGGKFWFDTKKLSWMLVNRTDIELWSVFTWKRIDGASYSNYDQYLEILLSEIKRDL